MITLLGLDGATWDLLQPLMAAGQMPHLQRLCAQGARGPLLSTWPPVTALAWPSFYTGQNPGKHGVFSFVQRQADGRERVVSAADVQAPPLWAWTSAAGLRSGVIGVPLTYPPRPLAGFLIPGFLTPPAASQASHPPGLLAELPPDLGDWTFHIPPLAGEFTPARVRDFIAALIADADRRLAAIRHLRQRHQPDLLISVWMATDTVQHLFWGLLHPDHPRYHQPEAAALRQLILPLYRRLDEIVGALAAETLPDGLFILMSDHGFGPVNRRLTLNSALLQHGYLRLHRGRLLANRLRRRARRLWPWARPGAARHIQSQPGQSATIDWPRTRAFAGAAHELCIHLNRSDRFRHGSVSPAAAPALAAEMREMLLALRDDAGQPLLAAVDMGAGCFSGPAAHLAPDLILRPADPGDVFSDGLPRDGRLSRPEFEQGRGWHRQEGIFLAVGAGVQQPAAWTAPPQLLDLAPTLLHRLGFAPPPQMDGRVLREMLGDAPETLRPLPSLPVPSLSALPAVDEQAPLIDRLRGLGYLE